MPDGIDVPGTVNVMSVVATRTVRVTVSERVLYFTYPSARTETTFPGVIAAEVKEVAPRLPAVVVFDT